MCYSRRQIKELSKSTVLFLITGALSKGYIGDFFFLTHIQKQCIILCTYKIFVEYHAHYYQAKSIFLLKKNMCFSFVIIEPFINPVIIIEPCQF